MRLCCGYRCLSGLSIEQGACSSGSRQHHNSQMSGHFQLLTTEIGTE
jgi:hypothetical protein